MDNKTKVLHITGHFGGGVGSTLKPLIQSLSEIGYNSRVMSLEYMNEYALEWAEVNGIKSIDKVNLLGSEFHDWVKWADIIHLHYWNHPLIHLCMKALEAYKTRIIIWAHVNGKYPPYLYCPASLHFPDLFVTGTPYSNTSSEIQACDDEWREQHLRTVLSCAGAADFSDLQPVEHEGIVAAYIGTVDYCKLHHNFLDICQRAASRIDNFRVIVCGGPSSESIAKEAEQKGIGEIFDFRGHVSDIKPILQTSDVFIYPLEYGGVTDQVLFEAMAAGVPPVTLDNGPEKFVVKSNQTGIIAASENAMVEAIVELAHNKSLRKKLSDQARETMRQEHTITATANAWNNVYKEALQRPQSTHKFPINKIYDELGADLFLTALTDTELVSLFREAIDCFPNALAESLRSRISQLPPIFFKDTQGSAKHYAKYIPGSRINHLADNLNQ